MKKIICILLVSLCMTAGAAACGTSQGITLEEMAGSAAATEAADDAASLAPAGDTVEAAAGANDEETHDGETVTDAVPQTPATVCVYVCGEVVTPGVYSLAEGARIYEALTLAGGLTDAADITVVNQARELTDGMMIRIPAIGESTTQDAVQTAEGSTAGTGGSANAGDTAGLVNINTADASQLCTLPGIGASKAAAILAYREEHGRFASKEELLNVSGIGDATYRNLESQIAVQ